MEMYWLRNILFRFIIQVFFLLKKVYFLDLSFIFFAFAKNCIFGFIDNDSFSVVENHILLLYINAIFMTVGWIKDQPIS